MTSEGRPLDHLYLEWLYANFIGVVTNRNPNSRYWHFAQQLYTMPFTWIIPMDKNRAEDGKELRHEFIEACGIEDIEINWLQEDCSVLEMLAGLARRAAFETDEEPGDWFWKFIHNLRLPAYNDRQFNPLVAEEVDAVLRRLLDREYDKNGAGGLFPLHHARQDQTQVDIMYQLQAYLLEGNTFANAP